MDAAAALAQLQISEQSNWSGIDVCTSAAEAAAAAAAAAASRVQQMLMLLDEPTERVCHQGDVGDDWTRTEGPEMREHVVFARRRNPRPTKQRENWTAAARRIWQLLLPERGCRIHRCLMLLLLQWDCYCAIVDAAMWLLLLQQQLMLPWVWFGTAIAAAAATIVMGSVLL